MTAAAQAAHGALLIGPDAAVGDVYSGGNLRVGGQTTIHGHITAGGRIRLGPGAAVTGRVKPGTAPSPELPTLELQVPWDAPSSGDVVMRQDAQRTLSPGRYGAVEVPNRAVLRLGPGDYIFDAFVLRELGRLELDTSTGVVRIFVQQGLNIQGAWVTGAPERVLVGYGADDTVNVYGELGATILAPRARVQLGGGRAFRFVGAVLAHRVVLRQRVTLTHRAFEGVWPWNR